MGSMYRTSLVSVIELKEYLSLRIEGLHAASSMPLTKAVQWTSERRAMGFGGWRLFRYKRLKLKTLYLIAQQ